ncbi:hypothetical protein [Streptomyces hundungensis]|uniref:hypothetical protein n=1 Tax=Streptomyces hundungensis TaxID=1077946 RepID=UPI0033E8D427
MGFGSRTARGRARTGRRDTGRAAIRHAFGQLGERCGGPGSGEWFRGGRSGIGERFGGNRSGSGERFGGGRSGIGERFGGNRSGIGERFGGNRSGSGERFGGSRSGSGERFGGNRSGSGERFGGNRSGSGERFGGSRSGSGEWFGGGRSGSGGPAGHHRSGQHPFHRARFGPGHARTGHTLDGSRALPGRPAVHVRYGSGCAALGHTLDESREHARRGAGIACRHLNGPCARPSCSPRTPCGARRSDARPGVRPEVRLDAEPRLASGHPGAPRRRIRRDTGRAALGHAPGHASGGGPEHPGRRGGPGPRRAARGDASAYPGRPPRRDPRARAWQLNQPCNTGS